MDRCSRQDGPGCDLDITRLGLAGDPDGFDGHHGILGRFQLHLDDVFRFGDLVAAGDGHSCRKVFHRQGDLVVEPAGSFDVDFEFRFAVAGDADRVTRQLQLEAGPGRHRRRDFQPVGESLASPAGFLFGDDDGELAVRWSLEGELGIRGSLALITSTNPFAGGIEHRDTGIEQRTQASGLQIHEQRLVLLGLEHKVVGVAHGFDAAVEYRRERDRLGRRGGVVAVGFEHVGMVTDGQGEDVGFARGDRQRMTNCSDRVGGHIDGDRLDGQSLSEQLYLRPGSPLDSQRVGLLDPGAVGDRQPVNVGLKSKELEVVDSNTVGAVGRRRESQVRVVPEVIGVLGDAESVGPDDFESRVER